MAETKRASCEYPNHYHVYATPADEGCVTLVIPKYMSPESAQETLALLDLWLSSWRRLNGIEEAGRG